MDGDEVKGIQYCIEINYFEDEQAVMEISDFIRIIKPYFLESQETPTIKVEKYLFPTIQEALEKTKTKPKNVFVRKIFRYRSMDAKYIKDTFYSAEKEIALTPYETIYSYPMASIYYQSLPEYEKVLIASLIS